ncbi:Hypothetical predicted protein, partial [Paramuricea clavata]
SMLAYVYIPLLQKELDIFKNTVWNNHRGRKQRNKHLPDGIPEHIYQFPEHYGGTKCGTHLSDEDLEEVAEVSSILEDTNDYLEPQFHAECERKVLKNIQLDSGQVTDLHIYLIRKYEKSTQRDSSANSATSGLTDLRQSPLHSSQLFSLNRMVSRETEMETTEIFQLREEIRNLNAKLAVLEHKCARQSEQLHNCSVDDCKINSENSDSEIVSEDSDERQKKLSAAIESTTTNQC